MAVTQADYLNAGLQLLPQGLAWQRNPNGNLAKLLNVRAAQLARSNTVAHSLVSERIPANAQLLIDEWEAYFGLPDNCHSEIPTLESRRKAIATKDNEIGSFNKYYLEELARQQGFEVRVVNHYPHHCLRDCTYPLHPQENWWRVFIYTQSKSIRHANCLDDVMNELTLIERSKVECVLKRYCYAHLEMVFIYED
ncbi:YmfQ family protein [Frederiksenia canicola]